MNLMERDHHTDENDWREDIKSDLCDKNKEEDNLPIKNSDRDRSNTDQNEEQDGILGLMHKPFMTLILLGIIVILLICIIVLVLYMPVRKKAVSTGVNGDLQQSITEYAQEQKKIDYMSGLSGETVAVDPVQDGGAEHNSVTNVDESQSKSYSQPVAADGDKNAIVVDVEDESDVSYSKEYILNEALPYFADNNQDAVWDLVHLKRYVMLSGTLENTNQYYYNGDVNSDGKPNGKGLAIYENNSYYYGDWVNGVRSGEGIWYRFYIGENNMSDSMGKYMAHSYTGSWENDLPNGQGAEHYDVDITKLQVRERILQNVVGSFTDGLYDGELYANTVDYTGNVEEWSGITEKGVFALWRDMSAIGECSVWRKNDDHSLYIDIDKSENKNQGITELIKISDK